MTSEPRVLKVDSFYRDWGGSEPRSHFMQAISDAGFATYFGEPLVLDEREQHLRYVSNPLYDRIEGAPSIRTFAATLTDKSLKEYDDTLIVTSRP